MRKEVIKVVEFDQIKADLAGLISPLKEVGDSL